MGVVTITVTDPCNNQHQRTYTCDARLLANSMRSLKSVVGEITPGKNLQLSILCDLHVFAWLMEYIKAGAAAGAGGLALETCLPILIAASFLQVRLKSLCQQQACVAATEQGHSWQ